MIEHLPSQCKARIHAPALQSSKQINKKQNKLPKYSFPLFPYTHAQLVQSWMQSLVEMFCCH